MKRLWPLLAAVAMLAASASADVVLYMTGRSNIIKRSTDLGATWTNWVNISGAGFTGIDVAIVGSQTNIFAVARDGGTATARPVYAFDTAGLTLAITTFDETGAFNHRPIGYFNNYVFVNAGSAGGSGVEDGSSSWDGSSFGSNPLTLALDSNWQANNMAFASAGSTDYQFVTGTSGTALRRRTVSGGSLSSQTNVNLSGPTGACQDIAFTISGRLLALFPDGWWLSAPAQVSNTSITMTKVFSFSDTEDPLTGDMGPNGIDFALLEDNLFAISLSRFYRYKIDDVNGTITFVPGSSVVHGFSNATGQIAVIPEPSVVMLLGLGLVAAGTLGRRR